MGTFTAPKAGLLTEVNGRISVDTGETQLQLQAGQRIEPGSKLVIGDDTKFEIQFDDGTSISNQTLNTPTSNDAATDDALQAEINDIQQQILAGDDPTEDLPETAAGQAGGQGHDGFSSVDRTGNETLGRAGYDTSATTINPGLGNEESPFIASIVENLSLNVSAPDNTTDTTPLITGSTNAAPGSQVTLVVTDSNGNQQVISATVQPDGSFSAEIPQPLPDGEYTVDGTVVDNNNNTANDSDTGSVDIAPPSVTVQITEDANDDGYINEAELNGEVNFTVTLGAGTALGDTLIVTDNQGNELFNGTVTQDMLDNGLELTTPAPETGTNLQITATVTDPAGNTASGEDSAILDYGDGDGAPMAPTVVITEDANNDGYINEAELNGEVNFTVTLGAGTAVGDTLVVTDNQGNELFTGTVTQEMIDNGLELTTPAPETGTNLQITATVTDPAGNTASNSDNANLTSAANDVNTVEEDSSATGNVLDNDVGNSSVISFTVDIDGEGDGGQISFNAGET
ncbi:retention module-containing protein, partial [Shewanella sp. GXUN23E]|uniref:retention module-containing protein n=1 Tax=Shewanella sp. GXUN23E TaxID=3422498 RepID=UPI003D7C88B5